MSKRRNDTIRMLAEYQCPNCAASQQTTVPRRSEVVGRKGYFDTAVFCRNCSSLLYVQCWPSGRTSVSRLLNPTDLRTPKFQNNVA